MRYLIILTLLALAGCDRRAQDAEEGYNVLQSERADSREKCTQAKKIADIYLQSGNQEKYHKWYITTLVDCSDADIKGL